MIPETLEASDKGRSIEQVLQEEQERNALRVIKLQEVISKTGLSRTGIYNRIRNHEFPSPISLGRRASGWIESEINSWIQTQIERRDKVGRK